MPVDAPAATAEAAGAEAVAAALAGPGYAVVRDAIPAAWVTALRDRARQRDAAGLLAPAGVGHGAARRVRPEIRGDRIGWLDAADATPTELEFLAFVERMRGAINRALMAGLFSWEGHYALFPPGAGYGRHVDRFRDDDARLVSTIVYLNRDWRRAEGGALHLDVGRANPLVVLPEGGTLVAFLSDRFVHEVRPATRPRLALTGWFRRREMPPWPR